MADMSGPLRPGGVSAGKEEVWQDGTRSMSVYVNNT